MAKIYQCGNCDNEVKFGAKFCDECGTKLEWPKEKVAKVKVTKTNKKKQTKKAESIELPINPDNLYKLIAPENSLIRNPVYNIVLFFFTFGGPILSMIMSSRQKKIHKWFNSLETEECDLSVFRKHVKSFRNCAIWAIILGAGFIVVNVLGLAIVGLNSNFYISSPILGGIGIAIGVYVIKLSDRIIAETESDELYTYKFHEESEEIPEHISSESENVEDFDEDDF